MEKTLLDALQCFVHLLIPDTDPIPFNNKLYTGLGKILEHLKQ